MKNRKNKLNFLAISAFALLSLAACGGTSPKAQTFEAAPQPEEGEKEEFGITQRENDLDDYEDLRPDREGFEDNTEPDTGTLVDHIFEFEEMAASGSSRNKDHMCSAISYVTSSEFSGNIAVECIDIGNTFTLMIESDKAVKVPMIIGLNNNETPGGQLGGILSITNNGRPVFDKTAVISPEGDPAEGAPSGYFDMVDVESTLSLVEGMNRINFRLTKNQINLDYVNLKTSANIVNKTTTAWDTPRYEVIATPTEKQSGSLQITCGKCGETNARRYLPKLSDPCYKVTEENHIKSYSIPLAGQDFVVATIDNSPENIFPQDTGKLVDNIFEFENASFTGNSQGEDHFCAGKSTVFGFGFSNGVCLEAIDVGTTLSFTINSDKRVEVPYKLGINNYHGNKPLSAGLIGKNNGNSTYIDMSEIVPIGGNYVDVGDVLTPYFNMVEASGTIKLVEGENKIEFTTKETGYNFDYLNIQTSATLTNNTISTWKDGFVPKYEVIQAPTLLEKGIMQVECPVGTAECCHRKYDYLYPLSDPKYIKEVEGDKTNFYLEMFGNKVLIGTLPNNNPDGYPLDVIDTKDNYFEFEDAEIIGNSGNTVSMSDHFCACDGLIYSKGFSNGFCLENTGDGTVFAFNIKSDKAVKAIFELGTTKDLGGMPITDSFEIKNNGEAGMVDGHVNGPTFGVSPDVGGLEMYFNMMKAIGSVNLVKGDNRIEIITKGFGRNMDFFNIRTSATLTDNTVSTWSGDNKPTFEIIEAPTADKKGKFKVTCAKEGCAKGTREYNYLPKLDDPYYTVKADGYYMTIFHQEIKVASKES